MNDASQPRSVRGKMLPAGILATALIALLALAPFASAASNPVASGSTTLTINGGFKNYLKTFGISIQKISPTKLKGAKATLTVTGGKLDPATGLGEVNLGGGLKFKAGKKTAPVKGLVLNTSKKSLTGKVAGKQMKVASVAGFSFTRNGFGLNLKVNKLKLTGNAAKALNKKLGYAKGKPKPFIGNKLMAKATSETQPSTLGVLPAGNATLVLDPAALKKLVNVGSPPFPEGASPFGVKLSPVAPTTFDVPTLTAGFPIGPEGTIGPTATAGVLKTLGGLQLQQDLEALGPNGNGQTTLKMANIWVDLATKTASVEVVIENTASNEETKKALNLGNLGRASIADINLAGATIASDPVTHTVSVTNASATLQAVTAETLNQVFVGPIEKATSTPQAKFAAGDPLGTFSFSVQTE